MALELTIKGKKGDDGLSAYQLCVMAGYVGSQEDWLRYYCTNRIEKYMDESLLPQNGRLDTVYFLNINGNKYLKYWDGSSYLNASDRIDLPNCISSIQRDFYAKFSDILIDNYENRVASIFVVEDETQGNQNGFYLLDGINLNWVITQ